MPRSVRRPFGSLLLAAGLVVLSGCLSSDPDLLLSVDTVSGAAPRGGVVEIVAGPDNPSIGDDWTDLFDVVPENAFASVESFHRDEPGCRNGRSTPAGCGFGTLVYRVRLAEDVAADQVTFALANCFRGDCPTTDPGDRSDDTALGSSRIDFTITLSD